MKKKLLNKKKQNLTRNLFNKKQYFTTFSNYNEFNTIRNNKEKVNKGTSTFHKFSINFFYIILFL